MSTDYKRFEVAATAIVKHPETGKFLVLKRADTKRLFPGKWTVPGGHLEPQDYIYEQATGDNWHYNAVENAVRRETKEEAGINIKNIRYVTNAVEPNFDIIVLSMAADLDGPANIKIDPEESSEYRWVTLEEAKTIGLIDGIYDELLLSEGVH